MPVSVTRRHSRSRYSDVTGRAASAAPTARPGGPGQRGPRLPSAAGTLGTAGRIVCVGYQERRPGRLRAAPAAPRARASLLSSTRSARARSPRLWCSTWPAAAAVVPPAAPPGWASLPGGGEGRPSSPVTTSPQGSHGTPTAARPGVQLRAPCAALCGRGLAPADNPCEAVPADATGEEGLGSRAGSGTVDHRRAVVAVLEQRGAEPGQGLTGAGEQRDAGRGGQDAGDVLARRGAASARPRRSRRRTTPAGRTARGPGRRRPRRPRAAR